MEKFPPKFIIRFTLVKKSVIIFVKYQSFSEVCMNICGIIAEYNPFHNGHKLHIEQTREKFGATHIVAVMSGNFTQRGDIAIADKYARAETALKNGVDLVIELPLPYALASAEQFARGAVFLLEALGCVDMLSFGSECGDIDLLSETAGAVLYAQQTEEFYSLMRRGDSFPTALQKTIEKNYEKEIMDALTTPNNTLAVEYLKALGELGSYITPVTIARSGAAHDDEKSSENIASASKIRRLILSGKGADEYLPEPFTAETADIRRLETAILAKLRTMSKSEIEKAPNVFIGLENRIYKAARVSRSLAELYLLTKTKRYTMARIRRIILSCFLGVRKSDLKGEPAYVHILGMNARGREILSAANLTIPADTSLKSLAEKGERERRQAHLEAEGGDLYALAFEKKHVCGLDYTAKPIILP